MLDHLDIADERWIAEVTEAIKENRIELAVQGVHAVAQTDRTLYGECLARFRDRQGTIHRASEFVPVLDLWGKTPVLDRYVIKLVLDELEFDKRAILGCNLSSDSLSDDDDWNAIKKQLDERAYLADRLVIELTETQPLGNILNVSEHIAEARQLGCRVAIDDFGSGFVAPNLLLKLVVDIVKIDASIVQSIKESKGGKNSLYHMIGLAKCAAPDIVVEGIETGSHLADAIAAGATHAQGYFLSQPVLLHSNEPLVRAISEGKTCH